MCIRDRVFFPEVGRDTDAWVVPTVAGVEVFHQLRSAESPGEVELGFELPVGASLRKADGGFSGAVEVVRDGKPLALVSPAFAHDAEGEPVPVEMSVRDDRLVMSVDHAGGDFLYPILVDPQVTEYSYWEDNGTGIGYRAWQAYAPEPSKWSFALSDWFLGKGLYVGSYTGYYSHYEYGEWFAQAHRPGIHTVSYTHLRAHET